MTTQVKGVQSNVLVKRARVSSLIREETLALDLFTTNCSRLKRTGPILTRSFRLFKLFTV